MSLLNAIQHAQVLAGEAVVVAHLEQQGLIPPSDPPRMVVCAAHRSLATGTVILGIRHGDAFMAQQMTANAPEWGEGFEQGFVDQFSVFMTREEAWPVALAANQIRRRVGEAPQGAAQLWSVNLY